MFKMNKFFAISLLLLSIINILKYIEINLYIGIVTFLLIIFLYAIIDEFKNPPRNNYENVPMLAAKFHMITKKET